jgi:glutamyl-tRNA synthetase
LETLLNSSQEEFETTIMEDLQMMEIVGDMVSHSSDFFDVLAEYAVKIIKSGKAYADDTEGAIVRRAIVHCNAQR